MGYQYVARDGNYGDASGMVFLKSTDAIDQTGETTYQGDDADEREYLAHADQHGLKEVWILSVDDNSSETAITVWASETDALQAIRVNYLDGDDDEPTDDSELIQYLCDRGYIVYLDAYPLPFVS